MTHNTPPHILITGANSGIGAALSLHYASEGVTLSLIARDEGRLLAIAAACREKGAVVETVCIDVTDAQTMHHWLTARDAALPITLLIANAGIASGEDTLPPSRSVFESNIMGVLNTIDPIMPCMSKRGYGQIALMASLAGYRGLPRCAAYSASKGFVKLYGEGLRGALKPHGVNLSVICPGFVRSGITDQNTCPMPFFMEANTAATIIAKGLSNNKGRIAFPWPMALSVWFLSILPDRLAAYLTRQLPAKTK